MVGAAARNYIVMRRNLANEEAHPTRPAIFGYITGGFADRAISCAPYQGGLMPVNEKLWPLVRANLTVITPLVADDCNSTHHERLRPIISLCLIFGIYFQLLFWMLLRFERSRQHTRRATMQVTRRPATHRNQ
jgi:hypothetical protein